MYRKLVFHCTKNISVSQSPLKTHFILYGFNDKLLLFWAIFLYGYVYIIYNFYFGDFQKCGVHAKVSLPKVSSEQQEELCTVTKVLLVGNDQLHEIWKQEI